jgi:hypothetical protein
VLALRKALVGAQEQMAAARGEEQRLEAPCPNPEVSNIVG